MACRSVLYDPSYLHFLLLAVFQTSIYAYISVNMEVNCVPEGQPTLLQLQAGGYRAAAIVALNVKTTSTPVADPETGDARCRLEVAAPVGHRLTVHLDQVSYLRHSEKRQGFRPCFLKVSQVGRELDELNTRTVDLCDSSSVPRNALLVAEHISLAWSPPDAKLAQKMVSKHLIITALGIWPSVCDTESRWTCATQGLCLPSEMVCDGFHNCPLAGDDEDADRCEDAPLRLALSSEEDPGRVLGFLSKTVLNTLAKDRERSSTTPPPRRGGLSMWRDMSDLLLKQLLNRHRGTNATAQPAVNLTTTTPRPLWKDTPTVSSDMGSIPAALAHYGPWGYLMLGMLICGAVLMLCGLWECCCRASKHRLPGGGPASTTAAATTVFIINSVPPPEEPPPTPGPPAYEELDQPPAYSSLFPLTKVDEDRVPSSN